jgi:hypothetical protein
MSQVKEAARMSGRLRFRLNLFRLKSGYLLIFSS